MAPTTPLSVTSGAASVWASPYVSLTRSARRSATSPAGPRPRAMRGRLGALVARHERTDRGDRVEGGPGSAPVPASFRSRRSGPRRSVGRTSLARRPGGLPCDRGPGPDGARSARRTLSSHSRAADQARPSRVDAAAEPTATRSGAMTGTAAAGRPRPPRPSIEAEGAGRDSRSVTGRIVVELGTPGRRLTSVASRMRVSGWSRTTTVWSAPVSTSSSSTIASTIASGDTDRESPWRIRATLSASPRRPISRPRTASRWRTAANPPRVTNPAMIQSTGWPRSTTRRAAAMRASTRNERERAHHVRWMRRSCGSESRGVRAVGPATDPRMAVPGDRRQSAWVVHPGYPDSPLVLSAGGRDLGRGRSCGGVPRRRAARPRRSVRPALRGATRSAGPGGAVTARALRPVHRPVGGRDELGTGPRVDREGRLADRRGDRHRPARLGLIGPLGEGGQDALGDGRPAATASVSGRTTANSSPP